MQIVALALVLLLMGLVTWLGGRVPEAALGENWLLSLGFILLAAFLAGTVVKNWGLPRITGYLLMGILVGPEVLGMVDTETLDDLSVINGLAVALIALSAGGELRISWLLARIRQVATVAVIQIAAATVCVALVAFLFRDLLPAAISESDATFWSAVLLLAVICGASSPMVAIALINESQSQGPLSRLILVITVFKDICVILMFTAAMEVARSITSEAGLSASDFGRLVGLKIFGSILFGIAIAVPLSSYCKRIGREMPAVVVGVCLFIALVGEFFGLEPLLAALALGCYIENFAAKAGHRLIQGVERTSLPVYCLFFAFAGVGLHLHDLMNAALIISLLVAARAVGVIGGATIGGHIAGVEADVNRWVWSGLLSQAGMSLAMASLIAQAFPGWGRTLMTIVVAMIAVHEVFGPIIFHWALHKSGEAGQAAPGAQQRSISGPRPAEMPA